jgi:hypothetical protein
MLAERRCSRTYALELSLDDNQLELLTEEKANEFSYFLQKEEFFFILGCLVEFSSFQ